MGICRLDCPCNFSPKLFQAVRWRGGDFTRPNKIRAKDTWEIIKIIGGSSNWLRLNKPAPCEETLYGKRCCSNNCSKQKGILLGFLSAFAFQISIKNGWKVQELNRVRSNPHWTQVGQHQFTRKSFDVACVQCEHPNSQQQVPFACICDCASSVDWAWGRTYKVKMHFD